MALAPSGCQGIGKPSGPGTQAWWVFRRTYCAPSGREVAQDRRIIDAEYSGLRSLIDRPRLESIPSIEFLPESRFRSGSCPRCSASSQVRTQVLPDFGYEASQAMLLIPPPQVLGELPLLPAPWPVVQSERCRPSLAELVASQQKMVPLVVQ